MFCACHPCSFCRNGLDAIIHPSDAALNGTSSRAQSQCARTTTAKGTFLALSSIKVDCSSQWTAAQSLSSLWALFFVLARCGLGFFVLACCGLGFFVLACCGLGFFVLACCGLGFFVLACCGLGFFVLACCGLGFFVLACCGLGFFVLACLGFRVCIVVVRLIFLAVRAHFLVFSFLPLGRVHACLCFSRPSGACDPFPLPRRWSAAPSLFLLRLLGFIFLNSSLHNIWPGETPA